MYSSVQKEFKGNVGLYLTAAKLSAMNLIVLTTSRNRKGCDIVILNPKTNKGKGIQVKCTNKKVFPIINTHLRTLKKELHQKITCDFVFVDISTDTPRFLILTKDEVCDLIECRTKESFEIRTEEWVAKGKNRKSVEELMASEKPVLHSFKLSEIAKFENKWDKILYDL